MSPLKLIVGAVYTDPDGSQRWCRNNKGGDLFLALLQSHGRERCPIFLTAEGTCALEWVGRTQDARVTLWV